MESGYFSLVRQSVDSNLQILRHKYFLKNFMADPLVEYCYAYMVEKVSDYSIFLVDCYGLIKTWNPAAEIMKGYTKKEIVGRHISLLYIDEDRLKGNPEKNLKRAAEEGTFQEETWRKRKDGSQFWALVEIIAIRNEIGQLSGFCKVIRDLSERRRMELALHEADRNKDEFLAMLGHELRNPLCALSSSAALLSLDNTDSGFAKKASQIIGRQVKHMTGLVEDLLDVSSISRGQIRLDMIPLDMKVVIKIATEQVRSFIESRNHTLVSQLASDSAYVNGDERRLVQVISNLLTNAAKYTPPGGNIKLLLSATDEGVCTEISDNGLGIEPEAQKVIFDMFEQVKRISDNTSEGLGIGLALARSLTTLHGGTVVCQSDGLGHGSRFTLCLPRLSFTDS